MGRGDWNLEEDGNLGFLRGMGAGRGGGELGAGCLGTEQEAGLLVNPPMGPAHLCQLPPSSFSHPNSLFDLSCPRGGQRPGETPAAGGEPAPDWVDSCLLISRASVTP